MFRKTVEEMDEANTRMEVERKRKIGEEAKELEEERQRRRRETRNLMTEEPKRESTRNRREEEAGEAWAWMVEELMRKPKERMTKEVVKGAKAVLGKMRENDKRKRRMKARMRRM